LNFDREMPEGFFAAGVDGFDGEEMHAVREACYLHGAADDGATG